MTRAPDDGLIWSIDVEGDHLVLVVRSPADDRDPGIRLPVARSTAAWLAARLPEALAELPHQD